MPKTHKLILVNENSLLPKKFSKDERSSVWKEFGFDKSQHSFSWDNEDYRQSQVNPNIDDAIPKEEDFLPFPFRHLSATIVGGGTWKATEFPEKILKASTKMLSNKPVYVNHNLEISNIVAGIGKTKWTPSFTAEDGTIIPGGIDAPIWVDGKLHADICRKLSAFPVPHIQSVSVTVVFEWKPSHVFENRDGVEDLWLFESRIGQMVDNEMVRRVATKIVEYYETSLVWLGADPFAKILDENNQPLNIEKSAIVGMAKFDKDPLNQFYKDTGKYFIQESCISNDKKLDLVKRVYKKDDKSGNNEPTPEEIELENNTLNNKLDMEKIIQLLAQRLGKKPEEITEDFLKGFMFITNEEHTSLVGLKTKVGTVEDYESVITAKDKFEQDLKAEQLITETNKPLVEFANSTLESRKENALKFYRLSLKEGMSEDEATVKLIERASEEKDFKSLESMTKQYGGSAFDTLGGKCLECGSTEVDFRTSEEQDTPVENEFEVPSLANKFRK